MSRQQYTSSVSPKGQITLPAEVRRHFGINTRDRVDIVVEEERITIQRHRSPFLDARGALPALDPPRDINEMTEIAAEEAAQAAARDGLYPDECS